HRRYFLVPDKYPQMHPTHCRLKHIPILHSSYCQPQKSRHHRLSPNQENHQLYSVSIRKKILLRHLLIPQKKENLAYYDRIFENHRIDHDKFFKSLNYYMNNHALLGVLTDSLNSYAQKMLSVGLNDSRKLKKNGHHLKDSAGQARH
ncbi:MAG: DUF4296 domain-containing protein, partial [Bacteroidota bacterium]